MFLISTIMKRWFPPFGFHTHSFMQVSSAISFRLPPASISADASPGSPLSCDFSGLPLSRPVAASASLSDLRCFRSLSVASVLDSDYSASVSSFPSLPDSASQWLPRCSALPFVPAVFPVLSCLVSRAFSPGSRYSASLYVSFRPSLIRSHSCSSGAYLPLSLPAFSVPLPLPFGRFCFPSGYSASCFFLSALWPLRLTVGSSSRLGSLRPLRSSPSSTAGFPSASF